MKKVVLLFMASFVLAGCAGTTISSQIRESGEPGSDKIVRCVYFSTGNESKTNKALEKYDGWKMIYISEQSAKDNKKSAVVMCFEKPSEKPMPYSTPSE